MFTLVDQRNAFKYANERMALEKLVYMHKTWPHIATHIKWAVTQADSSTDYYYANDFAHNAIKTTTTITQSLCEMLNCFALKNDGICTAKDETKYFWVGENHETPKVQCGPACFNLTSNTSNPQSCPLEWHDNACHLLPPLVLAYMERPYFRSPTQYERRVNDFSVGFDRDPTSMLKYKYNKYYCDMFFGTWKDGSCEPSWLEKTAGSILGNSIIKHARLLSRFANTGTIRPYPDATPLPKLEGINVLENWKKNIDMSWVVPNPKITIGKVPTTETEMLKEAYDAVPFDVIENVSDTYKKVRDMLRGMLEGIATREFWESLGIQLSSDFALTGLKTLLDFLAQKAIPKMVLELAELGADFSAVALTQAMTVALATTAARFAITELGNLIRGVLSMLTEMATGVGFLILVANVLDFILTVVDPFHLAKQMSQETLDNFVRSGLQEYHMRLNTRNPILSLDVIIGMLVPDKEFATVFSPKILAHAYDYYVALKTNSEGTPINHKQRINARQLTEPILNQLALQVTLHSPKEFTHFEDTHQKRIKSSNTFAIIGGGAFMLAIPFVIIRMYRAVAILFLISLVFFWLNFNIRLVKEPSKLINMFKL